MPGEGKSSENRQQKQKFRLVVNQRHDRSNRMNLLSLHGLCPWLSMTRWLLGPSANTGPQEQVKELRTVFAGTSEPARDFGTDILTSQSHLDFHWCNMGLISAGV